MSPKTRNIIGWILAGLISAFLLFSASGKFMDNEQMRQMLSSMGLTPATARMIGVVEIFCTLMFLIPRTGVVGTMLLAAYLGGAIATHIEHQQPPWFAVGMECVVWITAAIRFPELLSRLAGRRAGYDAS